MKRYEEREEWKVPTLSGAVNAEVAAESEFARAAYEWNNALLLAAERMWGNRMELLKNS